MEEMHLEEMRNQYAILKEQLTKQEIINDQLLRKTMKSRNKAINQTQWLVFGSALMCVLTLPATYLSHVWSLAFPSPPA